jgi:hypothetical protein
MVSKISGKESGRVVVELSIKSNFWWICVQFQHAYNIADVYNPLH